MITLQGSDPDVEHLLFMLLSGEKLAASISAKQAAFFKKSRPKIARFLRAQSRQELFHANVFRASLLWLNPKSVFSDREHTGFASMEKRMSDSLERGQVEESILGLQVVVEELGESALNDLDTKLEKYRFGMKKIRRIILNQEKAHHAFGERFMMKEPLNEDYRTQLKHTTENYMADAYSLLKDVDPALNRFNMSSQLYMNNISEAVDRCFA